MISSTGEYITVNFTSEELLLISERAEYLAEVEEIHPLWRQMYWQLSLSANHLSVMLAREELETKPILEKYEE